MPVLWPKARQSFALRKETDKETALLLSLFSRLVCVVLSMLSRARRTETYCSICVSDS